MQLAPKHKESKTNSYQRIGGEHSSDRCGGDGHGHQYRVSSPLRLRRAGERVVAKCRVGYVRAVWVVRARSKTDGPLSRSAKAETCIVGMPQDLLQLVHQSHGSGYCCSSYLMPNCRAHGELLCGSVFLRRTNLVFW